MDRKIEDICITVFTAIVVAIFLVMAARVWAGLPPL